jgi:hypothetical protein
MVVLLVAAWLLHGAAWNGAAAAAALTAIGMMAGKLALAALLVRLMAAGRAA